MIDEGISSADGISQEAEANSVHHAEDTSNGQEAPRSKKQLLNEIAQVFTVTSSMMDERQVTEKEDEAEAAEAVAKVSGLSPELLIGLRSINKQAAGKGEDGRLSMPAIEAIAQEYNKLGEKGFLPSEDIPAFIEIMHPELDPADKEKIVGHLTMTVKSEEDNDEDDVPVAEKERAQALRNEMEEPINEMYKQVRMFLGIRDDKIQEKAALLMGMLDKYQHRLDHFLNPEDPLKTWSKRGIKLGFKILIYSWYLIVFECAMINRATNKQGGRR